jgi:hypothetical protein
MIKFGRTGAMMPKARKSSATVMKIKTKAARPLLEDDDDGEGVVVVSAITFSAC